jgi:hypothetical protein
VIVMLESETIITVRRQLHGVAEGFIAGPQYRAAGTIRLAVRPDGFTGTALPVVVRHQAGMAGRRGGTGGPGR